MPILTTLLMFGLGAATGALSSRRQRATKNKKARQLAPPSANSAQDTGTALVVAENKAPDDDSGEAILARSLPLAVLGLGSAVAAIANPWFTLPAALICGH